MKLISIIGSLSALLILGISCSNKEPVATQYKKANNVTGGAAVPAETPEEPAGDTPAEGDAGGIDPALVEAGNTLYADSGCDGCHNDGVAPSLHDGYVLNDPAAMLATYTAEPSHGSLIQLTEEQAAQLAAAFQGPKP